VHLQRLDRLPALHNTPPTNHLQRLVRGFRWQLGFERVTRFAIRGTIASGLTLALLAGIQWLTNT